MTKRFLAVGECMIEMAPTEAGTYAMGFAGDTLNTVWYMRQLLSDGWKTGYFSAVGQDTVSEQMLSFLNEAGIETSSVRRVADKTVGLYMISLDDGERSFSYWRSDSAAKQLATEPTLLADAFFSADMIYFSGITLGILSAADRKRFLAEVAKARSNGVQVAFDSNLRPRLWASVSEMCEAVTDAALVSDIVLPSFEDEAQFFGDATLQATAKRYADCGVGTVIVKNGSGSLLSFVNGVEESHNSVGAVDVIDTTAAGDSFNAGFLANWLEDKGVRDCVQAGAALAARVVAHRGALIGLD
ncbi:MAG: sugar kinase [Rhodobacteraceae bacterium]|nr:sugar kinase [Paracoccaceae bacterium]